jgi:hypothetical protein
MAQFEIAWSAPEFEYHEKGVSWYWVTIIVAALIIAFSVWERNFLFGFFIVIAEILVIAWGNQQPRMVSFALNDSELSIGEQKSHSLKEFESWSTTEADETLIELMFNFRAKLRTPLKILAPQEKLEEIRKNLKPILKEVEHQSTLIDAIEKLMRF